MTYTTLTPGMKGAADRVSSSAARLRSTFTASYITNVSASQAVALIADTEAALRDLKRLTRNLVTA